MRRQISGVEEKRRRNYVNISLARNMAKLKIAVGRQKSNKGVGRNRQENVRNSSPFLSDGIEENILLARHRFDVRVRAENAQTIRLCILFHIKEFCFYYSSLEFSFSGWFNLFLTSGVYLASQGNSAFLVFSLSYPSGVLRKIDGVRSVSYHVRLT